MMCHFSVCQTARYILQIAIIRPTPAFAALVDGTALNKIQYYLDITVPWGTKKFDRYKRVPLLPRKKVWKHLLPKISWLLESALEKLKKHIPHQKI